MVLRMRKEMNFRDLGGYRTIDDRVIKRGVFFRSAAPGNMTDDEIGIIRGLGLKTVLDFRGPKQVRKLPDPKIPGAVYINECAAFRNLGDDLNYSPYELIEMLVDEDQKGGNAASAAVASYTAALAYSNRAYEVMFERLLNDEVPILLHCTWGKDRTGVAAMLIMLALGVNEKQIIEEYVKTNEAFEEAIERRVREGFFSKISSNYRTLMAVRQGVLPASATMFLAEIQERFDNYETFFEKEYDLTPADLKKLRDRYCEPAKQD